MVIVDHQESAAGEILADFLALPVGEVPMAHFHGVDPGPEIDFVVIQIQVHHLLARSSVDASEAPHALHELAVGLGKIGRPGAVPAPARISAGGVAQARKRPLCFLICAGGNRGRVDLFVGVFLEAALSEQSSQKGNQDQTGSADMAKAHAVNHPAPYAIQNIT